MDTNEIVNLSKLKEAMDALAELERRKKYIRDRNKARYNDENDSYKERQMNYIKQYRANKRAEKA